MLFRAQNLGPIRDAELDLAKSLIILAGPNNSGKTYLGWALYGLSRFNKALPCVRELVDAAIASPVEAHEAGPRGEFLFRFAEEFCALYTRHLHRDFAASASTFTSTLLSLVPDANQGAQQGGSLLLDDHVFRIDIERADPIRLKVQVTTHQQGDLSSTDQPEFDADAATMSVPLASLSPDAVKYFADWASRIITGRFKSALFRKSFTIFPVERIATTIFARELLLRRVEMLDEEAMDEPMRPASAVPRSAGRYPLPIRHSLLAAADLAASSREDSDFHDLADELEGSVLQGSFTVGEHGDMLFIPRASPQQSLGLHQSASVVKSLSSLVFYLRHLARKRDYIIIDEPELNLHPDNQRRVARVLAKAVNRGIKVMMSTHSDYLIGEFNNLLMLGRDTPQAAEVRQELGYDVASVLKPEQVGVYLVSEGLCKPVEVKETGFEIKTFEDAFHRMNSDAQTIYNRVFADSE